MPSCGKALVKTDSALFSVYYIWVCEFYDPIGGHI